MNSTNTTLAMEAIVFHIFTKMKKKKRRETEKKTTTKLKQIFVYCFKHSVSFFFCFFLL